MCNIFNIEIKNLNTMQKYLNITMYISLHVSTLFDVARSVENKTVK